MNTNSLSRPPLAPPVVSSSSSSSSCSSSSSSSRNPLPFCENSILALRCEVVAETCGFKDFPFLADPEDSQQCEEVIKIRSGFSQSRRYHIRLKDQATSSTYANYLFFSSTSPMTEDLNQAMDEELGGISLSRELPELNKLSPTEKQEKLDEHADLVLQLGLPPYSGHGYASICHYIKPFYLTKKGHFNYNSPHPTILERRDYIFKGFCYSGHELPAIELTFQRVWTIQSGERARVENFTALIKEMNPDFPQPLLDLMAAYDGRIFFLTPIPAKE